MPTETWETITGNENLLILATSPGDESSGCGGLIAQSCRRGRPPFVLVLTDGSASDGRSPSDDLASLRESQTRAAARRLKLPTGRLLMAGLFSGSVPAEGPGFGAVVHGITMVMWARDCNVICAPLNVGGSADQAAASRIAVAVASHSGVGLLTYDPRPQADAPGRCWLLDIAADLPAKRAALAEHRSMVIDPPAREVFVPNNAP